VDLKNGAVKIERAYAQVAGGATLKSTKTPGSVRTVPLVGYALERMREIGAMRIGPVVSYRTRRPDPHSVTTRFKRLVTQAGIRYVRFGNLRHTFASAAVEAGVPATTLQSLLGHASFSTTQKYVVSLGLEDAKAVRAVSDRIIHCVGFESG
jgi:integrase